MQVSVMDSTFNCAAFQCLLLANSKFYLLTFTGQLLFYLISLIGTVTRTKNKYVSLIYYYTVTIIAQWFGVYNIVTGRQNPSGRSGEHKIAFESF